VVAGSPVLALNIRIARQLGRIRPLVVHDDVDAFREAAARAGATTVAAARFDEPAVPVTRARERDGTWRLTAPRLSYAFRAPTPDVVLTVVQGHETGALGNLPFDTFDALLAATKRRIRWFLDLRAVDAVAPEQARCWNTWLAAREARFGGITVLAAAPTVALFVLGAKFRFRSDAIVRIVRTEAQFIDELAAR
jgi:hypothetical protein